MAAPLGTPISLMSSDAISGVYRKGAVLPIIIESRDSLLIYNYTDLFESLVHTHTGIQEALT